MPDDDKQGYKLVMAFPDPSPSFAHGFACGRIWQRMTDGAPRIEETVLSETRATIEAMAMAKGWQEAFEDLGEGWLLVRLSNPAVDADAPKRSYPLDDG